jgi:protein-cysteine N-palmitoyltransferase HHAT
MGSRSDSGRRRSGPLSFLRNLYDLDTLDTRFTTPSSVPYRATNDKREDDAILNKADKRAEPPKWKTPEYYLYYLVLVIAVPYMFWIAYDVSRRRFPILVEQSGRRVLLTLGSVGSEIPQV